MKEETQQKQEFDLIRFYTINKNFSKKNSEFRLFADDFDFSKKKMKYLHDWRERVVIPLAGYAGYDSYKCSNCGFNEVTKVEVFNKLLGYYVERGRYKHGGNICLDCYWISAVKSRYIELRWDNKEYVLGIECSNSAAKKEGIC